MTESLSSIGYEDVPFCLLSCEPVCEISTILSVKKQLLTNETAQDFIQMAKNYFSHWN